MNINISRTWFGFGISKQLWLDWKPDWKMQEQEKPASLSLWPLTTWKCEATQIAPLQANINHQICPRERKSVQLWPEVGTCSTQQELVPMDQSPILTGQSDIREVRVVEQGGEDFGAGIVEVGPSKSNLCVADFHFGDYESDKTGR